MELANVRVKAALSLNTTFSIKMDLMLGASSKLGDSFQSWSLFWKLKRRCWPFDIKRQFQTWSHFRGKAYFLILYASFWNQNTISEYDRWFRTWSSFSIWDVLFHCDLHFSSTAPSIKVFEIQLESPSIPLFQSNSIYKERFLEHNCRCRCCYYYYYYYLLLLLSLLLWNWNFMYAMYVYCFIIMYVNFY